MKPRTIGQTLFGIIVLVLGIGFLLDALNVLNFGSLIATWWPLFIIAIGVASYISNPRMILWPAVIVIVGILLQLRALGVVDFNVWQLIWPSLVILFGLSLLMNHNRVKAPEVKDDSVSLFVAFAGNETRNQSQSFVGGRATAIFGGIELDLTDAKIKGEAAMIDVFAAFGGVDIKVPDTWIVNVGGLPIFGGWDNKAKRPKEGKNVPTLNIKGTCLFGGVSVKN